MTLYRSIVFSLLLATPVLVMLSVQSISAWIISLIGGVIIFVGVYLRWGSVINLGLVIVGIDFLYHAIWTAFSLASIMLVSGFFFYLFTVQVLSSNLIEIEKVRTQDEEGVLLDYMSAVHQRLFEQVLGAFLVTMLGEFIAWNSIIGMPISETDAIFFFLTFGGASALLLFLIFEYLPGSEE